MLSPDGGKLLTGCADKQVRLWNLTHRPGRAHLDRPDAGACSRVAFSRKGDRVAAGSADKSVIVWEAGSNKEVQEVRQPARGRAVGRR